MKRPLAVLLALCLALFCLGGCRGGDTANGDTASDSAGSGPDSGLLTDEEIKFYEDLYLQDMDTLLDDLGLTEGDVDKEFGRWILKEPKTIAGQDFTMSLSISEEERFYGMYGVTYAAWLDDAGKAEGLYQAAVDAYGQPATNPGTINRLSENLDKLDSANDMSYMEAWELGEKTDFSLSIYCGDGKISANILYKLRTSEAGQSMRPQAR